MDLDGRETIRALPRFHIRPEQLADGRVRLTEPQSHKATAVLRLCARDEIAVLDGSGAFFRCRLTALTKHAVEAEVIATGWLPTEPLFAITLCQAVPKAGKLDVVVRACTAAGVARFVIFEAERSVAKWPPDRVAERLARLSAITVEEAELSLRARVPEVAWLPDLPAVLAASGGTGVSPVVPDAPGSTRSDGPSAASDHDPTRRWPLGVPPVLLYEGATTPFARLALPAASATLILGPEGGLSDDEVEAAREAGCVVASLGPRILRTEFAGLYALAALHTLRELAGS
jgi:16S rRNA (uracil1498-N3)-methyltransferase